MMTYSVPRLKMLRRLPRTIASSMLSYCLTVNCATLSTPACANAFDYGGCVMNVVECHPLFGRMCETDVARTKTERRNSRFVEQCGISPAGKSFNFRWHVFFTECRDE